MNWFNKVIQVFKIKEVRKKILFVFLVFAIFRVMANIPVPGIDATRMQEFFDSFQVFGLLNVFTGGALDKLSIVMLGMGPYITSTIILQLLTMIFPQLEKAYKEEGEAGRQRFNQYGRLMTIPLAFLQGYAMISLFVRQNVIGQLDGFSMFVSILTITAGTMILMWLGELISEKGIGNGVSLLIFAGIIADVPNNLYQVLVNWNSSQLLSYLLFLGMSVLMVMGVVVITEARRNIPVSYAKRVRGSKVYGGVSTYLPLSVNPAGVIPIIFALSILVFPGMIANFLSGNEGFLGEAADFVQKTLQNQLVYGILYFILVFLFTFFYTAVTFDPKNISSNLQKSGGFVPGIRPGTPTADFLSYVLNRVLMIGALFLGIVAVMPSAIGGLTGVSAFSFLIGGTSLLIVVSVVLETAREINAQVGMREYDNF